MTEVELEEWLEDTQRRHSHAMHGDLFGRVRWIVEKMKRASAELDLHKKKGAMYLMGRYGFIPTQSGMDMLMTLCISEAKPAMVVLHRYRCIGGKRTPEHVVLPTSSFQLAPEDWDKSLVFEDPVALVRPIDRLEDVAEQFKWFEERFDPYNTEGDSPRICRFCEETEHTPDCEYVLHGGKK